MCHRRGSLLTAEVPGPCDFKISPTVSLIPWWWLNEEVQRGLLCTGHTFLRGLVLDLASSMFPLQDLSAMWTPGIPVQRLEGTYAKATPNPRHTWRHPSDAHFLWPSIFSHWNFCVPTAWEHLIFIVMSFLQVLAKTSICLVWITHILSCQCRDVRDAGSIPGSGRSPGEGHGNPLQYSCLENLMDREAWCATVHGVTQNLTCLKLLSTHVHAHIFNSLIFWKFVILMWSVYNSL